MFFALTDEQQAFASTVTEFLADRFDLEAVRGVIEDPDGDGHPLTLWKGLADQGALAVLVPEEHDGLGLGLVDAQVVARALGAGVAPGPWLATVLAGLTLTDDRPRADHLVHIYGLDEFALQLAVLDVGLAVGAGEQRGEVVDGEHPVDDRGRQPLFLGVLDVGVDVGADVRLLVGGRGEQPVAVDLQALGGHLDVGPVQLVAGLRQGRVRGQLAHAFSFGV